MDYKEYLNNLAEMREQIEEENIYINALLYPGRTLDALIEKYGKAAEDIAQEYQNKLNDILSTLDSERLRVYEKMTSALCAVFENGHNDIAIAEEVATADSEIISEYIAVYLED